MNPDHSPAQSSATVRRHVHDYLDLTLSGLSDFLAHVPDPVLIVTPFGLAPDELPTITTDTEGPTDASTSNSASARIPQRLAQPLVIPARRKEGNREPSIWIGRATTCDIVLPFQGISRVHAVVRQKSDGGYEVGDLSSKNGTLLNGEQLEGGRMYALPDDGLVMFADVEVTFLLPETFFAELQRRPSSAR